MASSPSLEDLLETRTPSGAERLDASLAAGGLADGEIAAVKNAFAALAAAAGPRAAPPMSVRDRLLASRERARTGKFGVFADRIARLFDLPLATAEALMKQIEDPSEWKAFLVDGLEVIAVPAGPGREGALATFVRIQPGTKFPAHAHRGDETMLVLDGGFREEGSSPSGVEPQGTSPVDGEEVWRGDEVLRADGTQHALVGLPGVPCIAAVLIYGFGDVL